MTGGANFDLQLWNGSSGLPTGPTTTLHCAVHIFGMNVFFHGRLPITTHRPAPDRAEYYTLLLIRFKGCTGGGVVS